MNPFGEIPAYIFIAIIIAVVMLWLLAPFVYALWVTIGFGVGVLGFVIYVLSGTKFT